MTSRRILINLAKGGLVGAALLALWYVGGWFLGLTNSVRYLIGGLILAVTIGVFGAVMARLVTTAVDYARKAATQATDAAHDASVCASTLRDYWREVRKLTDPEPPPTEPMERTDPSDTVPAFQAITASLDPEFDAMLAEHEDHWRQTKARVDAEMAAERRERLVAGRTRTATTTEAAHAQDRVSSQTELGDA